MGMVTIEVPQQIDRHFLIKDPKLAVAVLQQLEHIANFRSSQPTVSDAEVLSVWADHVESPDEIARRLRNQNRQHD